MAEPDWNPDTAGRSLAEILREAGVERANRANRRRSWDDPDARGPDGRGADGRGADGWVPDGCGTPGLRSGRRPGIAAVDGSGTGRRD